MTTHIRRFNQNGIDRFRVILHRMKSAQTNEIPEGLLTDGGLSEIVSIDIEIEQLKFESKREMIGYILESISSITKTDLIYDSGMWTWLSAFYFDSVCPRRGDGTRKVGEDSRYILNPEEWNKYYRHLLASPTRLLMDLKELAAIYLDGKPDKPGDLFEQLASRQEIASCKGIIEAATILYWDNNAQKVKRGVRNKDGAGVLRRFVQSTIPQFQMTYDLNSMNGLEIISLLPKEYDKWRVTPA